MTWIRVTTLGLLITIVVCPLSVEYACDYGTESFIGLAPEKRIYLWFVLLFQEIRGPKTLKNFVVVIWFLTQSHDMKAFWNNGLDLSSGSSSSKHSRLRISYTNSIMKSSEINSGKGKQKVTYSG